MNSQLAAWWVLLFSFSHSLRALLPSLSLFVPKCHTQYCTVPSCCRHGDHPLAWLGQGVASVPSGLLAQIRVQTSRRTPNNHRDDRLCRVSVSLSMGICFDGDKLMFSLNWTILRTINSAKWQTLLVNCKWSALYKVFAANSHIIAVS